MAAATTYLVVTARPELVVFYHLPNGEHVPGQEVHLHSAEIVEPPSGGNSILVLFHDEVEFHHAQSVMRFSMVSRPLGGPWCTWLPRSQVEIVDPARKSDRRKR